MAIGFVFSFRLRVVHEWAEVPEPIIGLRSEIMKSVMVRFQSVAAKKSLWLTLRQNQS
jgi:hypothetical protein